MLEIYKKFRFSSKNNKNNKNNTNQDIIVLTVYKYIELPNNRIRI